MVAGGEFRPITHTQTLWQEYGAIADAFQAADRDILRGPQASDFPVTAFEQGNVIPVISLVAAGRNDVTEVGKAIIQHHALFQVGDLFCINIAKNAAGILPVNLVGWVHHGICQFAISGHH